MKLEELLNNINSYYSLNITEETCRRLLIDEITITRTKHIFFTSESRKTNYKSLTQATLDEANDVILKHYAEINRSLFIFLGVNYKDIIPQANKRVSMPYDGAGLAERMASNLYHNSEEIRGSCIRYFEKAVDYLIKNGKTDTKMGYEEALYKAKMICPECGRQLKAKYGKGRWFHGCTGYPRCTYTRKYVPVPKKDSD